MTPPRPKRWSITIGGTLPRRKPGTLIERAMSAYALSMLGLRSAKGTSTVILTRVGLSCSTVLGTVVGLLGIWAGGVQDDGGSCAGSTVQTTGAPWASTNPAATGPRCPPPTTGSGAPEDGRRSVGSGFVV